MKKRSTQALAILLAAAALALCAAGCGARNAEAAVMQDALEEAYIHEMDMLVIEDEAVALSEAPSGTIVDMPSAPGKLAEKNQKAMIDYSNTTDGYIMVKYTASTNNRLKVQVTGPSAVAYTYDLPAGEWVVFPLSDGNGSYKIAVCENVSGTKYSVVLSKTISVTLKDEFAPFLLPNQYVNYTQDSQTVKKARELIGDKTDVLEQVGAVYDYVVTNFTYDKQKAKTVKSGYLPDVDEILNSKTGICFDYAAVMVAMLRSQGIPTKLVVGYSGKTYHAWVNVYAEKEGWVNGAIFFDGAKWKLMDPTFASTSKQSDAIMKYIGDGSNYSAKYLY